jgi:hypothetical protein
MTLRRDYDEVLDDLKSIRAAIRLAAKAVEVNAGDKVVKRNLEQMRQREADLMNEASRYNPSTGAYRGRRMVSGVPR